VAPLCTRVPRTTITIMAGFRDHEFSGQVTCGRLCSPTENSHFYVVIRAREDSVAVILGDLD